MERFSLDGGRGWLTVREENGRARIEAELPDDRRGLYKGWLLGAHGRALAGTFVPEGGALKLRRTLSLDELRRQGAWPVTGGAAELAFAAGAGNVLNNAICILFAYWTNRTFVFKSQNKGASSLREFGEFIFFRLVTLVMDQCIIWLGVSLVGPMLGFASDAAGLWPMGVKVFSQVVVILSNYVFSKVFVFKKKS